MPPIMAPTIFKPKQRADFFSPENVWEKIKFATKIGEKLTIEAKIYFEIDGNSMNDLMGTNNDIAKVSNIKKYKYWILILMLFLMINAAIKADIEIAKNTNRLTPQVEPNNN